MHMCRRHMYQLVFCGTLSIGSRSVGLSKKESVGGYMSARTTGSGVIHQDGFGKNTGRLAFAGNRGPHSQIQGRLAHDDSPGHHREIGHLKGPRPSERRLR